MTTESEHAQWTVDGLFALFDAQPDGIDHCTADTGLAGADDRQVVEGSQVLAQVIVAAAKRFPDKSIRSVHAVFSRVVLVGEPVELALDVVAEGGSTATAVVTALQNGKRCIVVIVFADVPLADVIAHQPAAAGGRGPAD